MLSEVGKIQSSDGGTLLRMWSVVLNGQSNMIRKHCHMAFEVTFVKDGDGIYTVGGKDYPMSRGDFFIFASNEQHCITDIGEKGLYLLNMHFEPRFLWGGSSDRLSDENINICFSHNSEFENRIPSANAGGLTEIFYCIEGEFNDTREEYSLSVKSYLNLFLIKLIREHGYAGKEALLKKHQLHSLRKVISHIEQHYTESLSLNDLSRVAGLSPNYLSFMFHEVSGITLWDYINSRRIDRAIQLITSEQSINMIDAATFSGFNNTANFNKIFKKITGVTPTEYRAGGFLNV